MGQPLSEENKQQWKENILTQRQSKLSIASWCRQSGIAVHIFYYWQSKLFPKPTINRSAFMQASYIAQGDCARPVPSAEWFSQMCFDVGFTRCATINAEEVESRSGGQAKRRSRSRSNSPLPGGLGRLPAV